jgi:hypothetical protein
MNDDILSKKQTNILRKRGDNKINYYKSGTLSILI